MANPMNNKQQKKQKPVRYKGKNVDPMGDVSRMGRFGISMIKDIASGRFDFQRNAITFSNTDFVRSTLAEVERKIKEQNIYLTALQYCYGNSTDVDVLRLIDQHIKSKDGWTYVYETLWTIYNTKNVNIVIGMINRLPEYRYVLF